MAAKKQQNRVNSDRTGKAAGSRKSVRSGAQGASEGRKPGRPRRVQEPEPEQEGLLRAEVIVLGSFALAVLLFLSNFHLCGFAGDFLRGIQLGLFGGMYWILGKKVKTTTILMVLIVVCCAICFVFGL